MKQFYIKHIRSIAILFLFLSVLSLFTLAFIYSKGIEKSSNVKAEKSSLVDFNAYENLLKEVKDHRKSHLATVEEFVKMSNDTNTIILDTRSDKMYAAKHIKGSKHLDFTEFTQDNLAKVIPSRDTKILIYCNNNFSDDPINFISKTSSFISDKETNQQITLALNIPTYINLYGYGYINVYELNDLISVNDPRIEFSSLEK